jgi:beta-N-acetylhexosaminidase
MDPATLSKPIMTGILRGELGFKGVIVTDALEMGAVSRSYRLEDAAVRALVAGADLLVLGRVPGEDDVRAVQAAIVGAVRSGELDRRRLEDAAARVSGVVAAFPVRRGGPRSDRAPALDAARRALRVEGEPRVSASPFVIEFHSEPLVAAGESDFGLGDALRARGVAAHVVRAERARSALVPPEAPLVLVLRDAHRHPWQRAAAEELLARRPGAVVVETGLPVWRPPRAGGYVVTHGGGRVNLEAAAEALAPARELVS